MLPVSFVVVVEGVGAPAGAVVVVVAVVVGSPIAVPTCDVVVLVRPEEVVVVVTSGDVVVVKLDSELVPESP